MLKIEASPFRKLFFFTLPFSLCVLYLLWNYAVFNTLAPVSGVTKMHLRSEYFQALPMNKRMGTQLGVMLAPLARLEDHEMRVIAGGVFGTLAAIGVAVTFRKRSTTFERLGHHLMAWRILVLGAVFQYVIFALLVLRPNLFYKWYFVPQRILAAILLASLLEVILGRKKLSYLHEALALILASFAGWLGNPSFDITAKGVLLFLALAVITYMSFLLLHILQVTAQKYRELGHVVMAAVALLAVPLYYEVALVTTPYENIRTAHYLSAKWAREQLETDTVIAAWNAGILGYFSGHAVINLDGLVNSPGFLSRLERVGLRTYLQEEQVDYIVDVFPEKGEFPLNVLGSSATELALPKYVRRICWRYEFDAPDQCRRVRAFQISRSR